MEPILNSSFMFKDCRSCSVQIVASYPNPPQFRAYALFTMFQGVWGSGIFPENARFVGHTAGRSEQTLDQFYLSGEFRDAIDVLVLWDGPKKFTGQLEKRTDGLRVTIIENTFDVDDVISVSVLVNR